MPIKTSDGAAEDKARFVKEIEQAILDGEVDLGVHSAKDLPTKLPEGLEIAGVPAREDPRDAYVGEVDSLGECPEGSRIGTSSLRRRAQILALRPDLEVVEARGNVDTRLDKLAAGEYDGLVLAAAGLQRLGRAEEMSFAIEPDELVPARRGKARWCSRLSTPRIAPVDGRRVDHRSGCTGDAHRRASRGGWTRCQLQHAARRPGDPGSRRPDADPRLLRPPRRQRVATRRGRGGRWRRGAWAAARA